MACVERQESASAAFDLVVGGLPFGGVWPCFVLFNPPISALIRPAATGKACGYMPNLTADRLTSVRIYGP